MANRGFAGLSRAYNALRYTRSGTNKLCIFVK